MSYDVRRTRAEGLALDGEGDLDAVLLLGLLEHSDHDLRPVVDGEDDVLDTSLDESLRGEKVPGSVSECAFAPSPPSSLARRGTQETHLDLMKAAWAKKRREQKRQGEKEKHGRRLRSGHGESRPTWVGPSAGHSHHGLVADCMGWRRPKREQ